MLSLRKTADLIGVDKAHVSRYVRASRPVKGFDLAKYATYDSKGRIAGFNIPPSYLFPKSEDVRKGLLSSKSKENRSESAVNRVNVDHPLHVNQVPRNRNSNGENPNSERGSAKTPNDIYKSSINNTNIDEFETGFDIANRVFNPDDKDALSSKSRKKESESKVNAVNVDLRQSRQTASHIDQCTYNYAYKPAHNNTDVEPLSMATTSDSSNMPVMRNGQELEETATADVIEENPKSESVLLPALALGVLALGVDYAVNKEHSMASRCWRWLKRVSQPDETEPASLPQTMPREEGENGHVYSGPSIVPLLWHPRSSSLSIK